MERESRLRPRLKGQGVSREQHLIWCGAHAHRLALTLIVPNWKCEKCGMPEGYDGGEWWQWQWEC